MRAPPRTVQMIGSLLVALAIVAVAIAVVTAHFGPTSTAELEAREDLIDARRDLREDRQREREEIEEERAEGRHGSG